MDTKWPLAEPLATERFDLEPLRPGHAREMVDVLADPVLYVHTGGTPPSQADLAARYTRQARGVSPDGRHGWLNWVVRARDGAHAAGIVQATLSEHRDTVNADLAWVVGVQHQGAGVASEAATAVMEWLRTLGIAAFSAHIHPDNGASTAVARRLGLAPTSQLRDGEKRWAAPPPTPKPPGA